MWDYVVNNNLLESKDSRLKTMAWRLLNDETIYEYAFFKNEANKPFKYEAYQDCIAQCQYIPGKDPIDHPNRFIIFRASNQIGKSRFLVGRAKFLALNKENVNIVIISNNLKLNQFTLSELRTSLNNSIFGDSWKEDIGETDNTTMLTFEREGSNGKLIKNRIICAPAGEGSLGYPIHYLFLDEIDFYEEGRRLFWKVFYPRLNKTKGQCMVFSNPNPDIAINMSILNELWKGDLFKRKFHFNFLDASWNTKKEFEIARKNSPRHIFESTHLGNWSEEGGSFFTSKEIDQMLQKEWQNSLPVTDKPLFIGLDLGRQMDNSILGIGIQKESLDKDSKYKDLDVRYIQKFPLRTPYTKIIERLHELIQHYKNMGNPIVEIGFDDTGQKTFRDVLKKEGIMATPVDFSARDTNKTQLYNDFKLMSENDKIKIIYSEETERQLAGLVFKETASKKFTKVEAKTDKVHDDIPDMIAILVHIAVTPKRVPATITFVNMKANEPQEDNAEKAYDNYLMKTYRIGVPKEYGNNPYGGMR